VLRGAHYIRCSELCNKKLVQSDRSEPIRIGELRAGNINPNSGHLTAGNFIEAPLGFNTIRGKGLDK
jgi:hypothetical protein